MKRKFAWSVIIIAIVFINVSAWIYFRNYILPPDFNLMARYAIAFFWGCFCALGGTVVGVKILGDKKDT